MIAGAASGSLHSLMNELKQSARRPIHEALWPKDLFTQGLGWVIVARFKSAGRRVETGVFLVWATSITR